MASSDSQDGQHCHTCMKSCTDSVTLRCGHSICQVCYDSKLDEQVITFGPHTCRECRADQPVHQASINDTTSDKAAQKEAKIFCTYCIHSSVPAVKSCLHCEAALCDDHLKAHNKSPDHVLAEPTTSMADRKCPIHKKTLDYYCHEDAACICVYCLAEKHRFHQLEPLDIANANKKEKLRDLLEALEIEKDDIEKQYQKIIGSMVKIPKKVSDLKEKVAAVFEDIMRQLEDLEKRVLGEISRQETAIIVSGNIQMQRLQIKKIQLANKMRHIEELCNETNPLAIIECGKEDFYDKSEDQKKEDLKETNNLIDTNEFLIALTLHNGLNNIITETRKEFCIPEAKDLLLDLNTAANNVLVSRDLKSASWSVLGQRRKETAGRYEQYQVLSTQGFSAGKHYWEVEASESEYWMMGVTYPSTDPKSPESWIGNNSKSWSFCKWFNEYSIRHDNKDINTLPDLSCNRIGIYLDYEAGQVSFYELSDPLRHIHTFTTIFTEPLHAALWVEDNGWLTIRS